jgi:hypothetical protein
VLIGIEGNVGSGKTVYAVRCAIIDYLCDKKIIANLHLYEIEYERFEIDNFLSNEYNESLRNATVLLDEITVYMDCRLGSSKQNLLMGYLVLQSRKRGLSIIYTTQDLDLVDYKRLVKYTNIIVYAQPEHTQDDKGQFIEIDGIRNYTIIDMRKKKDNITQISLNIKPFYKYYNTDEIITPIVKWNKDKQKN